jgi:hypothetical protein
MKNCVMLQLIPAENENFLLINRLVQNLGWEKYNKHEMNFKQYFCFKIKIFTVHYELMKIQLKAVN